MDLPGFLATSVEWAFGARIDADWSSLDAIAHPEDFHLPILFFHGAESPTTGGRGPTTPRAGTCIRGCTNGGSERFYFAAAPEPINAATARTTNSRRSDHIKYGRLVRGHRIMGRIGFRGGHRPSLLILSSLILLLTLTGSVRAAEPLPAPLGFHLRASSGYTLSVVAGQDPKSGAGYALLFARSPHAQVLYETPAVVSTTSIEADLGAVGRIDVDFVPSGQTRTERADCGGPSLTFDSGSYVGEIDFAGEQGYSEAHATSAPGEVKTALSFLCLGGPRSEGTGGHSPGARLTVDRQRSPRFSFEAMKNSPTRPARFTASIREVRGSMRISRLIETTSGSGTFDFDVAEGFAHISPPAPFSGEATYLRPPDRRASWHGGLTVDFPGRPNVRLTGAGTRAGMHRAVLNPSHPFRPR